jgi:hypothetical protein
LDALIRHAPGLIDRLRVCWAGNAGGPTNCGRCRKCIRAMIVLRALGHLGNTPSFPGEQPTGYANRYGAEDLTMLPKIIAYARASGDTTLVRALERRLRALIWKAGFVTCCDPTHSLLARSMSALDFPHDTATAR